MTKLWMGSSNVKLGIDKLLVMEYSLNIKIFEIKNKFGKSYKR